MVETPLSLNGVKKATESVDAAVVPESVSEAVERERLLSKIDAEIAQLNFGPQSAEVSRIIGDLTALRSQVKLGLIWLPQASVRLENAQSKAENAKQEAYEDASEEVSVLMHNIAVAAKVKADYALLSSTAKKLVDETAELWSLATRTMEQKIKIISNIALPEEYAGTTYGDKIAEGYLRSTEGARTMAELEALPTEAKVAADITTKKTRQDIHASVESKDPLVRKQLRIAVKVCCGTKEELKKIDGCHSESAAKALKNEMWESFEVFATKKYAQNLKLLPQEQKIAIEEMGGLSAAMDRAQLLYGDDQKARYQSAMRYNEGDSENATKQQILDAACLDLFIRLKTQRNAEEQLELAKEFERNKELGKELTPRQLAIADPKVPDEEKAVLVADEMAERELARSGKTTNEEKSPEDTARAAQMKKVSVAVSLSVIKQKKIDYPDEKDWLRATPKQLTETSKRAAKSSGQLMADNFLTTEQKKIKVTSDAARKEAELSALRSGADKKTAEEAGQDAYGRTKLGGNVIATVVGGVKGLLGDEEEAEKAAKARIEVGRQLFTGLETAKDNVAGFLGVSTLSGEIEKYMSWANNNTIIKTVQNNNGQKIFHTTNKDGKLSRADMMALLARNGFDEISDFDKLAKVGKDDGEISQAEFKAAIEIVIAKEKLAGAKAKEAAIASELGQKDHIHDFGKITVKGKNGKPITLLAALDANKNGSLGGDDISISLKKMGIEYSKFAGADNKLDETEEKALIEEIKKNAHKLTVSDDKGKPPVLATNVPKPKSGQHKG